MTSPSSALPCAAPPTRAALQAPALPGEEAVLARRHGENFPVALRILPRAIRSDLLALYGFARLADDLGDEAVGDRGALLDALEVDLSRVFSGARPLNPLLASLQRTVRARDLPRAPLDALIAANRRDQTVSRYERFDDLLGYCELSANPVGRLVLGVFGAASAERIAQSDAICTALQLAEHWQDIAEDFARGRVYLPAEDRRSFGVDEVELGAATASPALRRLIAFEVARARVLLCGGQPLITSLRGSARIAVAGFAAGGHAALDAIAACDHDVLAGTPRPRRRAVLRHFAVLYGGALGR